MDKWLNEAYKGCTQTHYKFVDETNGINSPMVMKRKRSRVILSPEEREEISNFLADNRIPIKLLTAVAFYSMAVMTLYGLYNLYITNL